MDELGREQQTVLSISPSSFRLLSAGKIIFTSPAWPAMYKCPRHCVWHRPGSPLEYGHLQQKTCPVLNPLASGRWATTFFFPSLSVTFPPLITYFITIYGYQLLKVHDITSRSTYLFLFCTFSYEKIGKREETVVVHFPDGGTYRERSHRNGINIALL